MGVMSGVPKKNVRKIWDIFFPPKFLFTQNFVGHNFLLTKFFFDQIFVGPHFFNQIFLLTKFFYWPIFFGPKGPINWVREPKAWVPGLRRSWKEGHVATQTSSLIKKWKHGFAVVSSQTSLIDLVTNYLDFPLKISTNPSPERKSWAKAMSDNNAGWQEIHG